MLSTNETHYFLEYNVTEKGFDIQVGEFAPLLKLARNFINPWRVRRVSDGRRLAMSYDGFTSQEQARRNGRH